MKFLDNAKIPTSKISLHIHFNAQSKLSVHHVAVYAVFPVPLAFVAAESQDQIDKETVCVERGVFLSIFF